MNKIRQYFNSPALNSSKLKIVNNPKKLFKADNGFVDDEETRALRVGSAVDCLLTDPDRWDDEFVVLSMNRPTGLMEKFINHLPKGINITSTQEEYEIAYNKSGYKIPIERVIDMFWSKSQNIDYYNLINNNTKTILSDAEYNAVLAAIKAITSNPYTIKWFDPDNTMFQVPIYFNIEEIECKALLDGILIDDENKLIRPFDLKTTSRDIFNFKEIFYGYGYNIQAGLYYIAIQKWKERNLEYSDYDIDNFRFIVTPSTLESDYPALIFKVSDSTMQECIEEVHHRLDLYRWYLNNKHFLLPKEVVDNAGELTI